MGLLWTFFVINFIFGVSSVLAQDPLQTSNNSDGKPRIRRQFYVCPPGFNLISNNCYYFSNKMATWHDAHHDCRDRHSQLAIISTATEDQKLRNQLNKPSVTPLDWWIGGIYDWEQMQWTWGVSGKKLDYRGFSRMNPNDKEHLKWHCIIMDPRMKYKWNARSCVIGKHYICQTKVSRVGPRGLEKLRRKYKADENNQLNEIPVPMSIYDRSNGLKLHRPSNLVHTNEINSFAYRNNTITTKTGRKKDRKNRKGKGRKNRRNRNRNLQQTNNENDHLRELRRRNRRNKSKELTSGENSVLPEESRKKNEILKKENSNSMEDITQKTTYLFNTISPLHPRVIIEEHDFKD